MLDDIDSESHSDDLTALDNDNTDDLSSLDYIGRGDEFKLTSDELIAISGYGMIEGAKSGGATKRIVSLDELEGTKIGGGTTYHIDINSHNVDPEIRKIMPEKITECALAFEGRSTCSDELLAGKIAEIIKSNEKTTEGIIADAKKQTGCDTEKCVVEKVIRRVRGAESVKAVLVRYFKVEGPTNTKLLSNINIDTIMKQFSTAHRDFFPHPFNMRDYASNSFIDGEVVNTPDTLARITWEMLNDGSEELPEEYAKYKFKKCGCVINSDTYDGPGKHWMALYADWSVSPASIEFFNSAGNSPAPEFVNWMVKMKVAIENSGGKAETINVSSIRHQHSRTECGVYSLFYIWSRLSGIPYSYFQNKPVPDNIMFEFRQHLFSGTSYVVDGSFDLNKFKSGVQIDWESDHNSS